MFNTCYLQMFKLRKMQMSSFEYMFSVPSIYVWNSLNVIPSLSPSQFNFGFHRRDFTRETFIRIMAGLSWYTPYVHRKKLKSTPLLRVSQNHQTSVHTFVRSATLLEWVYDWLSWSWSWSWSWWWHDICIFRNLNICK
jgi:hypothetical protein